MNDLKPTQVQQVYGGINEGLVDWLREMMRELDRGYPGNPDPSVL